MDPPGSDVAPASVFVSSAAGRGRRAYTDKHRKWSPRRAEDARPGASAGRSRKLAAEILAGDPASTVGAEATAQLRIGRAGTEGQLRRTSGANTASRGAPMVEQGGVYAARVRLEKKTTRTSPTARGGAVQEQIARPRRRTVQRLNPPTFRWPRGPNACACCLALATESPRRRQVLGRDYLDRSIRDARSLQMNSSAGLAEIAHPHAADAVVTDDTRRTEDVVSIVHGESGTETDCCVASPTSEASSERRPGGAHDLPQPAVSRNRPRGRAWEPRRTRLPPERGAAQPLFVVATDPAPLPPTVRLLRTRIEGAMPDAAAPVVTVNVSARERPTERESVD